MPYLPKYRVGVTDRLIGQPANPPEGFIVLNLTNRSCFLVAGGLWTSLTTIPSCLSTAWNLLNLQFTYYVDPINGNDSNDGTSVASAWLTTSPADAQSLTPGQTIGYLLSGVLYLYRTLNMTMDMSSLPIDLITATANEF